LANHVHFQTVTHLRFFEPLAKAAVDEADGGEVLHAAEAGRLHFAQEQLHDAERIGAADAGEHGGVLDDRQYLAGHIHDNLIGVAIRHHAAEAAAAGHAKAPGDVDDDR